LLEINIAKVKNQFIFRTLALVIFFGLISLEIFAQGTGKIVGKVTDEKTGETLIGLNVKIVGATRGATTGVDGRYSIAGLAVGKYAVEFSYVGYQTKKISDVDVKAGEVHTLNVVMSEGSSRNLKEVIVNIAAKKETAANLYATQKNSAVVSDGVSAEIIKKSPDKNTGEVLKRVPGATIQEGKFVVVRGLSDRYNNATLDNGALPSTEPNRKAFSFDIVPSNLVDAIVIKKTATPDMAGDFAGGSVAISTKDIPDNYFLSFGVGYSFNSQSTFKPFYGNQLGANTFLGVPNALQLSSSFPKDVDKATKAGAISAMNSIKNDWNIKSYNALPGQNYQFSLGSVKDFNSGQRLGGVVSLTYRNSENITPNTYRNFNMYQNYVDDIYKLSTSIGALANIGYSYGGSKITLKNIYNKNYDNQYLTRSGHFLSTSKDIRFYAFDEIQKSLLKTTLEGEHKLGAGQSKIKWTGAYSHVGNSQPDQRKVNYFYQESEGVYYANLGNVGKENARMFADLNENIYSGELAYSTPFKMFKQSSIFKTGVSSQYRNRDFSSRFIGLELSSTVDAAVQNEIRQRPISKLYDQSLVEQGFYSLKDASLGGDSYNAHSLTNSGYVMLDNKLGQKLRAVWGVRVEQYKVVLKGSTSIVADVDKDWLDVLPSANLTYALTEKANLRASFSRTLARPEFREQANASYYDYELLAVQKGNTNLKRTQINNADLRYEFYPKNGQVFSVSAFYKDFTNAIEPNIYDVNSTVDITYKNAPTAHVYGVELELRKNLDFITSLLKNTSVYTNLSFMKSEAEVINDDNSHTKRPLAGQSPYVINAGLQHSAFSNKLALSVLYNRIGRRINKVQGLVFPHVWEDPRDLLDFQLGYKLFKSRSEVKLNISDILNQRSVVYFDRDLSGKYSAGSADETIGRYKPGTNISLSFSYSLR